VAGSYNALFSRLNLKRANSHQISNLNSPIFSLMPVLFPYNKFTVTKLIKCTVFTDHMKLLQDRQEELLGELKALTSEGFRKAEEEWVKSVLAWG
jgi:hypothetical protein